MNIKTLFPSPWLHATDLPRAVTVKVSKATIEKVRSPQTKQEEDRLILTFVTPAGKPTSKRLICNKTQAFALATITNSLETDNWPGALVILSAARAHNGQPTIAISPASAPAAQSTAQEKTTQADGQETAQADDEIDDDDSIHLDTVGTDDTAGDLWA